MPSFDRLLIVVIPGEAEWPFSGDASDLSLRVNQRNQSLGVLRISPWSKSRKAFVSVTGNLAAGSVLAFGNQSVILEADFDGDGTPEIVGGLNILNPFPALDSLVVIEAIAGDGSEKVVWASLESQDTAEQLIQGDTGPTVVEAGQASFFVGRHDNISVRDAIVDDLGNRWAVTGISDLGDRRTLRVNCQRIITSA